MRTVLIVDDKEMMRDSVGTTLERAGLKVLTASDGESALTMVSQSRPDAPVRIGRHCWLGKNAIVLPGVELGDHCIVAAGAVVTKSFGPGSTVAGVPARLIARKDTTG